MSLKTAIDEVDGDSPYIIVQSSQAPAASMLRYHILASNESLTMRCSRSLNTPTAGVVVVSPGVMTCQPS